MFLNALNNCLPHSHSGAHRGAALPLSKARCGERLRVVAIRADAPDGLRLRELGFHETAEVCKVSDGSALICRLRGARLAIGRDLGAEVMVEPIVS